MEIKTAIKILHLEIAGVVLALCIIVKKDLAVRFKIPVYIFAK